MVIRHATPASKGRGLPRQARRTASVLIIVLVTVALAAFAITQLISRASRDLLVETRHADAQRLRREAFSAMETTMAVLAVFREVNGSLRSPSEGWGDPLGFASYEPPDGVKVTVSFDDESGKLSLPRSDATQLKPLFESFGLPPDQVTLLTDALMGWMKSDYVAESAQAPEAADYERADLPFTPPGRSLRSFDELRAIEGIREAMFDDTGRPTDLYYRFTGAVSLLNFDKPNLNAARPDVLTAIGGYDQYQRGQIGDYLAGRGVYTGRSPGFFSSTGQLATILGAQGVSNQFGTEIRALTIHVIVSQGRSEYELTATISPSQRGGATVTGSTASSTGGNSSSGRGANASASRSQQDAASTGTASAGDTDEEQRLALARKAAQARQNETDDQGRTLSQKALNYPFTLLEISEGADTSPPPAPSSDESDT